MSINQFDEYSALAKAMNEAAQLNDPITHLFAQPRAELAELEAATRAAVAGLRAAGCRDWDEHEFPNNNEIWLQWHFYYRNGVHKLCIAVEIKRDYRENRVVCEADSNSWGPYAWLPTEPPPAELVAAIKGGDR